MSDALGQLQWTMNNTVILSGLNEKSKSHAVPYAALPLAVADSMDSGPQQCSVLPKAPISPHGFPRRMPEIPI